MHESSMTSKHTHEKIRQHTFIRILLSSEYETFLSVYKCLTRSVKINWKKRFVLKASGFVCMCLSLPLHTHTHVHTDIHVSKHTHKISGYWFSKHARLLRRLANPYCRCLLRDICLWSILQLCCAYLSCIF